MERPRRAARSPAGDISGEGAISLPRRRRCKEAPQGLAPRAWFGIASAIAGIDVSTGGDDRRPSEVFDEYWIYADREDAHSHPEHGKRAGKRMLFIKTAQADEWWIRFMTARLPLSALLSHALVAYTIEFDNEFEHRMPHRTTRGGQSDAKRSGPWLVSLAMWSNCMQFVPEGGISVEELERRARTRTNLAGMQRWKYITVTPDKIVRPTPFGRQAQRTWQPLFAEIETRWRERFGAPAFDELRAELAAVVAEITVALPDCLPILGYGLVTAKPDAPWTLPPDPPEAVREMTFAALLAKALIAFAMEFESESPLSFAISANVLRLVPDAGVRVSDLPGLCGLSKEAIAMCGGFLERRGDARIGADPYGSRFRVLTLTQRGRQARESYELLVEAIERRWRERYGESSVTRLRSSLEQIVRAGDPEGSTLLAGLKPYPDGWRARVPAPSRLPHFPAVSHRGGYPDGS